ncbi:hypothetical protein JCM10213_001106 [Rhodosporidiobolus nylandii]
MPSTTSTASAAARAAAPRSAKKRPASASPSPPPSPPPPRKPALPASKELRMAYKIGRGEDGVFGTEPWTSHLKPMWRFATPDKAKESSSKLWTEFEGFVKAGDFPGSDVARKFLQMGMTRATRYARRAGGKKYDKKTGELLPQTTDHPGAKDKAESAAIFREVWERCKADEGYQRLRKEWEAEKKAWEKEQEASGKKPKKEEDADEAEAETPQKKRRKVVKKEESE